MTDKPLSVVSDVLPAGVRCLVGSLRSIIMLLSGAVVTLVSPQLRAQSVSETQPVSETQSVSAGYIPGGAAAGIEDVAFSLAVVLLLIFALAWLARRYMPGVTGKNGQQMHVLASLHLGGKERLMLVDIAGTQMVIGVSPNGVQCLHVFPEPVSGGGPAKADLNASFGSILQGLKKDRDGN